MRIDNGLSQTNGISLRATASSADEFLWEDFLLKQRHDISGNIKETLLHFSRLIRIDRYVLFQIELESIFHACYRLKNLACTSLVTAGW
jgi:hypothetical protein